MIFNVDMELTRGTIDGRKESLVRYDSEATRATGYGRRRGDAEVRWKVHVGPVHRQLRVTQTGLDPAIGIIGSESDGSK